MSAQLLHFRWWRQGRAASACRESTQATTTPNKARINCVACKAKMEASS